MLLRAALLGLNWPSGAAAMRAFGSKIIPSASVSASASPGAGAGAAGSAIRLAAAWLQDGVHHVGAWRANVSPDAPQGPESLRLTCALAVPTRAHGLCAEPAGTVLTAARRPGDWLLRWDPRRGRALQWHWIEADRAFNGHVLAAPDGRRVFTAETDLESGTGLIGVRDASTLRKLAEWPTHGLDPHDIAWLPGQGGDVGGLLVANGGIPIRPETGRVKVALDRMDSSLVLLDGEHGRLLGQWRVNDGRLSLRHLSPAIPPSGTAAPSAGKAALSPLVGIAMQAEHDDATLKAQAPLLALWDGASLHLADQPGGLALSGYGGDVAALPGGWAVSATRAGQVARWTQEGQWQGTQPLEEACALMTDAEGRLWAAGPAQAWTLRARPEQPLLPDRPQPQPQPQPQPLRRTGGPRLDNHWIVL